jgi:RNA polymerase sigma factor (sigma-70 family)
VLHLRPLPVLTKGKNSDFHYCYAVAPKLTFVASKKHAGFTFKKHGNMVYQNEIGTDRLLIQLKSRSEAAFAVLYDQYAAVLWSVALKIVKNEAVAEEILQDTFVNVWRFIEQYDSGKGTLLTWMLNITRNRCKDYFRSKYYQNTLRQEGLSDKHHHVTTGSLEKREESAELLILAQKLEPKYHEIIDLVYIHGYSQEEVSAKLNIPLGTVKTRCREAIRQLRRIYLY